MAYNVNLIDTLGRLHAASGGRYGIRVATQKTTTGLLFRWTNKMLAVPIYLGQVDPLVDGQVDRGYLAVRPEDLLCFSGQQQQWR